MKSWQAQVGFWGAVIWMASFQALDYANAHHYDVAAKVIVGYTLGVITGFAGFLFLEILNGRCHKILGEGRVERIFAAMPVLGIFLFGAMGFLNDIFGSTPWYYNLTFFIGGAVVGQGMIPLIDYLDRNTAKRVA